MRAVLLSIFLAALVSLVAIPPLASALTFTRPLAFGSSGTDVSALQQYLQTQGYFHYPDITGYFGPYTWRALAAFQWDNKLEPVGYLGPKTELALNKLLDQSLASLAPSTSSAPAALTATSTISLVPIPPPAPIYTTPPPTPAVGQPWQAPSGGGGGGGPPAPAPEPAPAPAPYVAKAAHFDGSTYLSNSTLVSSDNTKASFSQWFYVPAAPSHDKYFIPWIVYPTLDISGFDIEGSDAGGGIEVFWGDSAGVNYIGLKTPPLSPGWHNVLSSVDSSTGVFQVLIDGTVPSLTVDNSSDPFTNTIIPFNGLPFVVGSNLLNFGVDWSYIGDMADLWVAPGVFIDFSVEANRRKFITADGKPVDLGPNCSAPTGTAPAVCFSGDVSSFGTNKGTGGAFTTSGTLTNAATSPSN